MPDTALQDKVSEIASAHEVPGIAAGVLIDGQEHYAFHGVTSVENPLPVDATTLFQFGSTGKTFTATATMRLVEQGKVDLDAPVRRYLPEFTLTDSEVAERVTVLQLFNHTAGWEGDMMDNTGDGDDALEKYVARMSRLKQVSPPGATVSYNNASLSVAGRIIEMITGTTYEQAIRDLLLDPLGLEHTFFFTNEIMTRRFAVGHRKNADDTISVARPWALPRGNAPAGGMSANAADQLAWARFHLGDGSAADGSQILKPETVALMKVPTVDMRGNALGDYVGISWLLRDVDGVRLVGHGGTTNGQYSDFTMAPDKRFAVISMANCGPNGSMANHEIAKWCLEHYAGVIDKDPEPVRLDAARLAAYEGHYETIAATCDITAEAGYLSLKIGIKPEMRAVLQESGEELPDEQPPVIIGLLSADTDHYVVAEGDAKGMRGYFVRDEAGTVTGAHVGGRLATRVSP